jgi:hypothetical protein
MSIVCFGSRLSISRTGARIDRDQLLSDLVKLVERGEVYTKCVSVRRVTRSRRF